MLFKKIKKSFIILYSAWVWFWICTVFITHCILVFFTHRLTSKPQQYSQYLSKKFLSFALFLSGLTIHASGTQHIPTQTPFILASNHQSLFDIALHIVKCPRYLLFTPKIELLKIPFLGWTTRHEGHVSIHRSNPRMAIKNLQEVHQKIQSGKSFIFFPEGTRSINSTIKSFKKGAFKVALKTGVPIIPTYIHNANQFLNKKTGLLAKPAKISLIYGPPISSKGKKIDTLTKETEEAVRNLQKIIEKKLKP